jgi:hypothetical protein
MLNKKCALILITYSLFNRRINELFQKTMTNGIEAVLCQIAFYYFINLKYQSEKSNKKHLIFERNMVLMTFAITMAFLIRSSSLIGWFPLAIASILSTNSINSIFLNLSAICKAGILVAVPLITISIGIDSLFYGKLTFP